MRASHLLRVLLHALLHPERRVAGPHGVVLVGQRRAEERHDPVAHHLVHRALVAVDGLHHPFEHRIEDLTRLLGVTVGEQLHRALEVREEDRHLLALALQGRLGGEDLLREVLRGVGLGERSSGPAAGFGPIGAPHSWQNLLAGGFGARQAGQAVSRRAPHSPQNFTVAGFSCWHRGHFMPGPPSSLVGEGRNGEQRLAARLSRGQGHEVTCPCPPRAPRPSPPSSSASNAPSRSLRLQRLTAGVAGPLSACLVAKSRPRRTHPLSVENLRGPAFVLARARSPSGSAPLSPRLAP